MLGDVDRVVVRPARPHRDGMVDVPARYELAIDREHLHAVVLPVAHDHPIRAEHRDVMRQAELPVVRAGLAPGEDVLARPVQPVDA